MTSPTAFFLVPLLLSLLFVEAPPPRFGGRSPYYSASNYVSPSPYNSYPSSQTYPPSYPSSQTYPPSYPSAQAYPPTYPSYESYNPTPSPYAYPPTPSPYAYPPTPSPYAYPPTTSPYAAPNASFGYSPPSVPSYQATIPSPLPSSSRNFGSGVLPQSSSSSSPPSEFDFLMTQDPYQAPVYNYSAETPSLPSEAEETGNGQTGHSAARETGSTQPTEATEDEYLDEYSGGLPEGAEPDAYFTSLYLLDQDLDFVDDETAGWLQLDPSFKKVERTRGWWSPDGNLTGPRSGVLDLGNVKEKGLLRLLV